MSNNGFVESKELIEYDLVEESEGSIYSASSQNTENKMNFRNILEVE